MFLENFLAVTLRKRNNCSMTPSQLRADWPLFGFNTVFVLESLLTVKILVKDFKLD